MNNTNKYCTIKATIHILCVINREIVYLQCKVECKQAYTVYGTCQQIRCMYNLQLFTVDYHNIIRGVVYKGEICQVLFSFQYSIKYFVIHNTLFVILLISPYCLFVTQNFSTVSRWCPFLSQYTVIRISSIFPNEWSYSNICCETLEL